MSARELMELKLVLEEERSALIRGAVEEILKWSAHKIRLLQLLQDKDLSSEEIELLKELQENNEKNRKLIVAGLSFVEEAYRLMNSFLIKNETYHRNKNLEKNLLLSRSA